MYTHMYTHTHTQIHASLRVLHIYTGDAFLLVWKPKGDVGISTVADASLRRYSLVPKYLTLGTKVSDEP
jgi:hypothetical protein